LALFTVSFPFDETRENAFFLLSAEACHRFRVEVYLLVVIVVARTRDDERVEKQKNLKWIEGLSQCKHFWFLNPFFLDDFVGDVDERFEKLLFNAWFMEFKLDSVIIEAQIE
jgi:hypothetical protein